MAKSPSFPLGHTVKITGTFKVDGVLTNPTACTITVREPDGTLTTPSVTSESTGVRSAIHLTDQVGWYRWKVEGTGTAAAVKSGSFYINSTGL